MMRAMREITKPVFWVVAISFIGWMAYGQITDIVGGGKDVVLSVDGAIVRSQPFQQQYQATLEQYRRQQGGGRLTREDERQLQDRVADQFIQKILLERAYRRFGITVSDDEIIQAARSSPPPQILQQVLQDATFQTNGQFDITKWQRYISSAGSEFASQVEQLRSEEHTSELQSPCNLVCRLLLEKKKKNSRMRGRFSRFKYPHTSSCDTTKFSR